VAVGFTLEAAVGFGATLVSMTLCAFFVSPADVLPALVPLNLALSLWVLQRDRAHVAGRVLLRRVLPWMGLGLPLGLVVGSRLATTDTQAPTLALGAMVVVIAARGLWRPLRASSTERGRGRALLVLAGVVHGALGTSGPLVVGALAGALPDKAAFRATLAALWALLNVALCGALVWQGRFPAPSLFGAVAAGALLGAATGSVLHAALPGARFVRVVWAALLLAGCLLLLRAAL
jgi:hypothetical protein